MTKADAVVSATTLEKHRVYAIDGKMLAYMYRAEADNDLHDMLYVFERIGKGGRTGQLLAFHASDLVFMTSTDMKLSILKT